MFHIVITDLMTLHFDYFLLIRWQIFRDKMTMIYWFYSMLLFFCLSLIERIKYEKGYRHNFLFALSLKWNNSTMRPKHRCVFVSHPYKCSTFERLFIMLSFLLSSITKTFRCQTSSLNFIQNCACFTVNFRKLHVKWVNY